jgi:hypothetical protein
MTMRQEIRKRFTGHPRLWEAAVAVEDVKPYLLEFGGGLTPLSTGRERLLALVSTKSESAAHLQRDRKRFEQARAREARQFAAEKAIESGNGTFFTVVKPTAKGSTLNFYQVGGDKLIHRDRPGF